MRRSTYGVTAATVRIDVDKANQSRSDFDILATINTGAEEEVIQQLIKTYVSISRSDVCRDIRATLVSR